MSGHLAMNPVSAVAFILCGIALLFIRNTQNPRHVKIGKIIGGCVLTIGFVRLLNFLLPYAIDQTLFPSSWM